MRLHQWVMKNSGRKTHDDFLLQFQCVTLVLMSSLPYDDIGYNEIHRKFDNKT